MKDLLEEAQKQDPKVTINTLCVGDTGIPVLHCIAQPGSSEPLEKVIEEYGASIDFRKLYEFDEAGFGTSLLHQCVWCKWYYCAGDILKINPDLTTVEDSRGSTPRNDLDGRLKFNGDYMERICLASQNGWGLSMLKAWRWANETQTKLSYINWYFHEAEKLVAKRKAEELVAKRKAEDDGAQPCKKAK